MLYPNTEPNGQRRTVMDGDPPTQMTEEERYGFRWGPLVVQCCCHDDNRLGYVLLIRTDKGREVEIRVSPKGDRIDVEHKK
jgi:hypothetical protein